MIKEDPTSSQEVYRHAEKFMEKEKKQESSARNRCYLMSLHLLHTSISRSTTCVGSVTPAIVNCWMEFFNMDDDYIAMTVNIFLVLNSLLGSDYTFLKQKPSNFTCNGKPDVICHCRNKIIVPIELKRQMVLVLNSGQLDYHSNSNTKDVVDQIYSYMAELELQYGVLSTYDNHWFLYQPKDNPTELQISLTYSLDSTLPTVLKAYAFLAHIAKDNPYSPHPSIIPE
nr:3817_t:CDS:2 [Entrophospora candida]